MSYLHCHTKGCGWSQDDFYSWRYNPATKIWDDLKQLWKPRIIRRDGYLIDDLVKYTIVPIIIFKNKKKGDYQVFSWNWLILEIVKDIKLGVTTKWWTQKSFKKAYDKGKAFCPKCKKSNMFDID